MSTWLLFCLICIVYFEKKAIDEIGSKIWARIKFEFNYYKIRKSIRKEERNWL